MQNHVRVAISHSGASYFVGVAPLHTLADAAMAFDKAAEHLALFGPHYPDVRTWVEIVDEGDDPFDRHHFPGRRVDGLADPLLKFLPLGSKAQLKAFILDRAVQDVPSNHAAALLQSMTVADAA